MRDILVITEGATEREVGRVLYERGVLSQQAEPELPPWYSQRSREGYHSVISEFQKLWRKKLRGKVLLMFDQEDLLAPEDRRVQVARDLGLAEDTFQPVPQWSNLFEYREDNRYILLHVSTAMAPHLRRGDFDGYILQLLQSNHKEEIARKLLGNKADPNSILKKAEQELTNLMEQNQYPWQTAKAWLYAYITVFQFRQSHVWFAKRVVEVSPEDELKRVFASLIAAWDRLIP